jgi:type I protein arginine methyltransferase
MSWCVKSAVSAPAGPERQIQYIPSMFAGFADIMGFHRHLLDDHVRTDTLIRAINAVVKPGDVVIDLGTGTGILAMAAARAGAERVYALEHSSTVHIAQALARENQLDSKIEFVQTDSHQFDLPTKADVIVSECFGLLGVGGTMFSAVSDLIRRNLKPTGIVIPASVTIYVAPVQSSLHFSYVHCWHARYGFSFDALRELSVNNLYLGTFEQSDFLAASCQVANLNFLRDLPTGRIDVHARFKSQSAGWLRGFCGWFDAHLCDNITLGTGPASPPQIWRQVYFPLHEEIFVAAGACIELDLAVLQSLDSRVPISFYWRTAAIDSAGKQHCFIQSTLKSFPVPGVAAGSTRI